MISLTVNALVSFFGDAKLVLLIYKEKSSYFLSKARLLIYIEKFLP